MVDMVANIQKLGDITLKKKFLNFSRMTLVQGDKEADWRLPPLDRAHSHPFSIRSPFVTLQDGG